MILPVGVVQTTTGLDMTANAAKLVGSMEALAAQGARLLFTPEMSGCLDRNSRRLAAAAMAETEDPVLAAVCAAARRLSVAVALGSLAVRAGDGRLANRSFLISPKGEVVARYDKLHLFDVALGDGETYRESRSFSPGEAAVATDIEGIRLGLTICYDLRFPLLFAALARAGAEVIAVPAAFTVPTGRAHWEILLRARAIETGCFIVAAAQSGVHEDGRETWGHSLVVDPWGEILLDMGTGPGIARAELDLGRVAKARSRIPALSHARDFRPPAAGARP